MFKRFSPRAVVAPLVLACTAAMPVAHAATTVTLAQAVFQENLFATSLFHAFGTDDARPESFAATNDVGFVAGTGMVLASGGALPRVEGALSFSANGNPTTSLFGQFYARVYYEWTVEQVGGDPFTGTVPIDVHTRGAIERSANTGAKVQNLWAQASIDLPGTGLPSEHHLARGCIAFICTPGGASFDDSFTGQATPDSVYHVTLLVLGNGYLEADKSAFTMSGWVDPQITIAPDFARRDDFRLVFSSGVLAVPEPSTAWLGLGGLLALLGSARWRGFRPGRAKRTDPTPR